MTNNDPSRKATYHPDTGGDPALGGNALNQIGRIEVPRSVSVLGEAHENASVTFGGVPATKEGIYFESLKDFSQDVQPDEAKAGIYTVLAELPGAGEAGTTARAEEQVELVLAATPRVFTYDDDGNLTSDGLRIYIWNGANRLKSVETDYDLIAAGADGVKLEFTYDYMGRRFKKVRHEWTGGTWMETSTTYYIYDGWNLVAEIVDGQEGNMYFWGLDLSGSLQGAGGVGGLLAVFPPSQAAQLPIYDGNGNILAYVDAASTELSARLEYGPFGEPLRRTGPLSDELNYGFSTKPLDAFGLYYYGYRFYDPETGRWPSRDPIEEQGGYSLYAFVGNDGVNSWDYLGERDFGSSSELLSGPDVTSAVLGTIFDYSDKFLSLSDAEKCSMCLDMLTRPEKLTDGWDISPLKELGFGSWSFEMGDLSKRGLGDGLNTAIYNGKVFDAGSVNYILLGRMYRMCYEEQRRLDFLGKNEHQIWAGVKTIITLHKEIFNRGLHFLRPETRPRRFVSRRRQAISFARSGYWGDIPTGGLTNIPKSESSVNRSKFSWTVMKLSSD
jgi:RHS repeat-associated protein